MYTIIRTHTGMQRISFWRLESIIIREGEVNRPQLQKLVLSRHAVVFI